MYVGRQEVTPFQGSKRECRARPREACIEYMNTPENIFVDIHTHGQLGQQRLSIFFSVGRVQVGAGPDGK